jgi:hypothetical protein
MSRFISDCSHCCGLCCIVPAYLQQQGFPCDKPAHVPCRHLDSDARCGIHAQRRVRGFGACCSFDCHGAGQWITQALFAGGSWRDSPATARQMAAAWQYWLPRFKAAALLEAALPFVGDDARQTLRARIEELCDARADASRARSDQLALQRDTLALIRSLLR